MVENIQAAMFCPDELNLVYTTSLYMFRLDPNNIEFLDNANEFDGKGNEYPMFADNWMPSHVSFKNKKKK